MYIETYARYNMHSLRDFSMNNKIESTHDEKEYADKLIFSKHVTTVNEE